MRAMRCGSSGSRSRMSCNGSGCRPVSMTIVTPESPCGRTPCTSIDRRRSVRSGRPLVATQQRAGRRLERRAPVGEDDLGQRQRQPVHASVAARRRVEHHDVVVQVARVVGEESRVAAVVLGHSAPGGLAQRPAVAVEGPAAFVGVPRVHRPPGVGREHAVARQRPVPEQHVARRRVDAAVSEQVPARPAVRDRALDHAAPVATVLGEAAGQPLGLPGRQVVAGVLHPCRGKQRFVQVRLVALAGHDFDHRRGEAVADVRVLVARAGLEQQRRLERPAHVRVARDALAVVADRPGKPRLVRQQVMQRDRSLVRGHAVEEPGDRVGDLQLARLLQPQDPGRGELLRDRPHGEHGVGRQPSAAAGVGDAVCRVQQDVAPAGHEHRPGEPFVGRTLHEPSETPGDFAASRLARRLAYDLGRRLVLRLARRVAHRLGPHRGSAGCDRRHQANRRCRHD